jgi:hypothetical protein
MTSWKKLAASGLVAAALVAFAAPALAQDSGDSVTVHYFRPDGKYDGWGLHVWESFQKAEEASDEWAQKQQNDRPLEGVSWFKPVKPTGKDDFGITWTLPAKEFGNGRVNYIIHKGDTKDQCSKDMFWMIKDSKDAWVVSGDCKVYMSKDEALKSPKAKK